MSKKIKLSRCRCGGEPDPGEHGIGCSSCGIWLGNNIYPFQKEHPEMSTAQIWNYIMSEGGENETK
jgi:hypothetical protein